MLTVSMVAAFRVSVHPLTDPIALCKPRLDSLLLKCSGVSSEPRKNTSLPRECGALTRRRYKNEIAEQKEPFRIARNGVCSPTESIAIPARLRKIFRNHSSAARWDSLPRETRRL